MTKRYYLAATLLLGATAGMAQKTVSAYPIADGIKPGSYVYSLPLTTLTFKVKAAHLSFRSGPYAQYAQKYLGIADAGQADKEYYRMLSIGSQTSEEADTQNIYFAEAASGTDMTFLELTKQGLIVPTAFVTQTPAQAIPAKELKVAPPFTDLGADPSIYKEKATFFSDVKMDTAFVKVPVQKNMLVEKSPESKASDAANFIFNLRKRRVDLISGDVDNVFNNGEALKAALAEISRLEKEYLSLFIGKTYVDSLSYHFDYTPQSGSNKSSAILFRFSENKGAVAENDLSGKPIMVEVTPTNATQQLPSSINDKGKDAVIVARYPEVCTVKVIDGKETLFSSKAAISQAGKIVRMPIYFPSSKR
jgi:hypothetical protein